MSDSTVPNMRVEDNEVVIGPWSSYQGDYTCLDLEQLPEFIRKLMNLHE